jgi:hypothetical protein
MGQDEAFIGVVYECDVRSIENQSTNSTHLTGISGVHLPGFSSFDVRTVFFEFTSLSSVPQGIQKFFPNLISLRITGSPISSVTGAELNEYKNLQIFIMIQTNLIRLPENFFHENLALRHISFSNNRIQHVGMNLLDHLSRLEWVDFVFNVCIHAWATTPETIIVLKENLRRLCPDI